MNAFLLVVLIASTFIKLYFTQARSNESDYLPQQIKSLWYCQQKAILSSSFSYKDGYCPTVFDGWTCWEATPVGQEASNPCPPYLLHIDSSELVTRHCLSNGTWDGDINNAFVNYSACGLNGMLLTDQDMLHEIVNMVESLPLSPHHESAIEDVFDECVQDVLIQPLPSDGRQYCGRTFDGWGCWNDTPAGEMANISCPNFIPGFDSSKTAHKLCQKDGTWFRHPDTNKTWSNYTTCIDQEDLMFRQHINTIYISGYSVSTVALIISLIIFYYFKSLKCTRITIHKNLFISFVVNNIMWIVWYTEVVEHPSVFMNNEASCQALHIIVHYLMVSNYFWMFCEGLYLHTVLVVAFVTEETIMKGFYFVGWGIPLLLIILYATLRGSSPENTTFCWIHDSVYQWILSGPVCVSLLLNLLFLINIVRVLVTKLRAVNSPDANQTKKAARATLILIPLLGLHYLLTPFRPEPKSSGEAIYETVSAIVTSFQGLCVAFLFCFFNGEVTAALRRKWNLTRLARTTGGKRTSYAAATSVSGIQEPELFVSPYGKRCLRLNRIFTKDNIFPLNGRLRSFQYLGRSPSEPDSKFCHETQVFSEV